MQFSIHILTMPILYELKILTQFNKLLSYKKRHHNNTISVFHAMLIYYAMLSWNFLIHSWHKLCNVDAIRINWFWKILAGTAVNNYCLHGHSKWAMKTCLSTFIKFCIKYKMNWHFYFWWRTFLNLFTWGYTKCVEYKMHMS